MYIFIHIFLLFVPLYYEHLYSPQVVAKSYQPVSINVGLVNNNNISL